MFSVQYWQVGDPGNGKTTEGEVVFDRNTVKYRNGISIETIAGDSLASCTMQEDAIMLLGFAIKSKVVREALKRDNTDPRHGIVSGKFKVRWLTDDGVIGVTEIGRRKLPGWTVANETKVLERKPNAWGSSVHYSKST